MERIDPAADLDERAALEAYVDYHRATLWQKCAGLDDEQLRFRHRPSEMSLGGLLNHLALVEDWWFCHRFAGWAEAEPWASVDWEADNDWEWHTADELAGDVLRERYRQGVDRAREAIVGRRPDELSSVPLRDGQVPTLRWTLLHMIEEYARHNGHADLIREAIDGTVGE